LLGDQRPAHAFPIASKESASNLGYFLSLSPRGKVLENSKELWADLPKRMLAIAIFYSLSFFFPVFDFRLLFFRFSLLLSFLIY
jgi:hypothetical protein